jgi:hypothetical protein
LQQFVVTIAMRLEVPAQVEQRLLEHAALAEQKREQEPPHPSVAVEKRVNGLELHMHQSEFDQQRQPVVIEVLLEAVQALQHGIGGRRDEKCIPRTGSSNPVLAAAKFAGSSFATPASSQEYAMDLAQQTKRNRKPFFEPVQTVLNCGDIVRGFLQIVHKRGGTDSMLEEQ